MTATADDAGQSGVGAPPAGWSDEEWSATVDELVARSAAASGVPLEIEDEGCLAAVARLLDGGRR